MKIRKDIKNDLMNRREVEIILTTDKTPSFAESSKLIAEHFKAHEDNIMVENIKGKFGRNTFLLKASVYDSKELKEAAVKRLTKQKKEAAPTAETTPAA